VCVCVCVCGCVFVCVCVFLSQRSLVVVCSVQEARARQAAMREKGKKPLYPVRGPCTRT
jgi:hypothetical protein